MERRKAGQRFFNTTGACNPQRHYMVDIRGRLAQIKGLVDNGEYFTINRARQYGKTTTMKALKDYLGDDYVVVALDFQKIGNEEFKDAHIFSKVFSEFFLETIESSEKFDILLDHDVKKKLRMSAETDDMFSLRKLFVFLSKLCETAAKPVVLMIDEVDSATNNQVFLDFLAQLRSYYLDREQNATFQSVILAGVYDVKNIRRKLRPDEEHKVNSPWNIAADFRVNMSFSKQDIAGMLSEYETDHHTGMNIEVMAGLISEYTSGYPFLVSRLCKLMDEDVAGTERFADEKATWTREGFLEAEKMLVSEKNTLFESLTGKLADYPELKEMLGGILFEGKEFPYVATNPTIELATLFDFIRNEHNTVAVSNRIFETVLYNHLLLDEALENRVYDAAVADKNRFIENGHLNMRLVLEQFVETFDEIYGDRDERFLEEVGRKYFMLFLKPIINGTGHSYVEARTRNMRRTDIVVDYRGEQFVVELKIWSGAKYHAEGEQQLTEYLDCYHLKKGYLLTFNFNKEKEIGVKEVQYGDKLLVEAVV